MVGVIDYILEAREKLQNFATTYYLKLNSGAECFNDKLKYIIANVYLEIISTESVFPNLSTDSKTTIINCLNSILGIKKTLDFDNLIYDSTVTIDESTTGVIL